MLAGSIANSKLSNSEVTVTAGDGLSGGGSVSLGGTVSFAVGVDDSSIEINSDALRVKASGITNAMLAGSIANSKLSNSAVTVGSTSFSLGSTSTTLSGLTDVTIDGSGGLKIKNGSTSAGFMEIYEDSSNGTNKIRIQGPESLSGDITLTLPNTDGNANQVLKTDGSGLSLIHI